MKILFLADLQSVKYEAWQDFLKIDKNSFDIIATLGDIFGLYLKQTRDAFPDKKIIGVLGNHDQKGKFAYYNIEDIHNRIVDINGVKIAGIEGCVKYKESDKFPLYTQFEIIKICHHLDKADIIISHNSPFGIHDDKEDIAHIGYQGLWEYIGRHRPKYCVHGHQHIDKVTKYLSTKVIGIHGASIFDINTGCLEKVF